MKQLNIEIVLVFVFVLPALSQTIVDFTYSEYLKDSRINTGQDAGITVSPYKQVFKDYQFPNACHLSRQLNSDQFDISIDSIDTDDYVNALKNDFMELLKLGEKIRHKRNKLIDLTKMGGAKVALNVNKMISPNEQLPNLEKREERLKTIDQEIKDKSGELENMVRQSIESSENNQFMKAALNFDIESLKLKRDYLKDLLSDSQNKNSNKIKTDYEKYFQDLRVKFDQENELIQDLDAILANYNEIGELKEKISSIRNKIQIGKVMLEEKQSCAQEIEEIRKLQRNHTEIQQLMNNLREKKKDVGNRDNKYCEGVTKKLEARLKNVLMSYDYTFECADGKDRLKQQIDNDQKVLDDAIRRLSDLENNAGIDDYKDKFQKNRDYIKSKNIELQTFQINPYHHDPQHINELLLKVEQDLQELLNKRQGMNSPTKQNKIDYRRIHELIVMIKSLKGSYCRQYEQYMRESNQLENRLNKYEASLEYQTKAIELYLQQNSELERLEEEFERVRERVHKKIVS